MKLDLKIVLTVFVMVIGFGTNWGIASSKIEALEVNVQTLRDETDRRFDESRARDRDLELTQVKVTEALKSIQSDISEIKIDVKAIGKTVRQ